MMKIILLKDIKNVGKKFDIKEVSDGYALNYLLPKGFAVEGNKNNIAKINDKNNSDRYKREKEINECKELGRKLNERRVIIYAKSGENGKLFGAITVKEIAEEIYKEIGIKVDKKKIVLDEQIKMLGVKIVNIRLCSEVSAKLYVEVKKLD